MAAASGRAVPSANLHVTLVFLGSVPEARLELLGSIARSVATAFPSHAVPVTVTLTAVEHWKRAQLLCAVADKAEPAPSGGALSALVEALREQLLREGFAPDLKPFRAHVTLARKVARSARRQEMPRVTWSFRNFALVASRTAPSGSLYSVVDSWTLGGDDVVEIE
jgi:2'-5' RNA ligase